MGGKFNDYEDSNDKRKRKNQLQSDDTPEIISTDEKKKKNKKSKKNKTTNLENQQNGLLDIEKSSIGLELESKNNDDLSTGSEINSEIIKKDKKKKKRKSNDLEKQQNGLVDDEKSTNGSNLESKNIEELASGSEISKKVKKNKKKTNNDFENKQDKLVENEKLGNESKLELKTNDELASGSEKKSNVGVVVSGKDWSNVKYKAMSGFNDVDLPKDVMECCKGFDKPSPIQAHAWPYLLDGRDFIGIAQTGSGKTLAFGIPAMMHVIGKRKSDKSNKVNPLCLFLSPTRELAQQIADVLIDAGKSCGVRSACFYGGTSKGPQLAALRSGVDIVIATPGRLKDLIEMGKCHLKEATFVVLDEADRMLDMGFEQDVRSILSQTSSVRQMVMFSATWPTEVRQLAQEFMDPNPIKVVVGSEDLAANHDVMQIVEVLEEYTRDNRLLALLEKYHKTQKNRVIVFVLYQKEADRVERFLQQRGWNVVGIHAGKQQQARTQSLAMFKSGKCPLLIATDVAARGLDIPDVEVVINYSFPLTTEDYVHRIGRTGRAGKKGVAHTFFTKENKGLAGELVNVLREAEQHIPQDLVKFGTHVKKKESKLYGAHFKEITADAPKATKITFGDSDDE